MSDFIKVNFKSGCERILHKQDIQLFDSSKSEREFPNVYSVSTVVAKLNCIAAILSTPEEGRDDEYFSQASQFEITREEYDRLCKELGVE